MDKTKKITILIPLRIDFSERKENLDSVVSFFLQNTSATILLLEADRRQQYFCNVDNERLRMVFIEDEDPIFYRTHYINQLLKMSLTNIVGIWDTDVLIPLSQILLAVENIANGATMSFPYDGRFIELSEGKSKEVKKKVSLFLKENEKTEFKPMIRPSVGGAFFVNKDKYMACGGENENFYGWGPEDAERVKRMEILEESITRVKGALFHLHHSRGINSGFDGGKRDVHNLISLMDTCKRNKAELKEYISSWTQLGD